MPGVRHQERNVIGGNETVALEIIQMNSTWFEVVAIPTIDLDIMWFLLVKISLIFVE